jgi:sialic acid synthase SpsE
MQMSVFIAAEVGVAWNGDRARIPAFIQAAKDAGADAVKFQAFNAAHLIERRGIKPEAMMHAWNVQDLLQRCELSDADLDMIAAESKRIGIKWFASVFDPSQVERVLSRGAACLKIGHAEATYDELLLECAAALKPPRYRRKPTMACWVSVTEEWGGAYRGAFGWPSLFSLVTCRADYPAAPEAALRELGDEHQLQNGQGASTFHGFSSHHPSWQIPAAAALRGAEYIEFHLKLTDDDPEAAWSLSVEDATKCCKQIREYESWL